MQCVFDAYNLKNALRLTCRCVCVWVDASNGVWARVGAHTYNCQRWCQMLSTRSREMYRIHVAGGCHIAFYFLHLPVPSRVCSSSHTLQFFETFRKVDLALAPLSTRGRINHRTPCSVQHSYNRRVAPVQPFTWFDRKSRRV